MEESYPQETLGTTLIDVAIRGERRRIYLHQRLEYWEVGEFTQGPLTQEVYGAPVHLHCVHLANDEIARKAAHFFKDGEYFLADYMDSLDEQGIAYGYLNNHEGGRVSYRPARSRS